jgi:ribosomal protein S18 acetylase RimI-like enzyme
MDIEHGLTAAMVVIAPFDPAHPMAQQCLRAYVDELNERFETGFDPARSISAAVEELRPPDGAFLLASMRGSPVGCGALKFHGTEPTEIKRMWVDSSVRGLGIGRRLLTELEGHAARNGATIVRLETNGTLTEAIALYRSAGYVEVAAFNDEPYAHHWFEKRLRPPAEL